MKFFIVILILLLSLESAFAKFILNVGIVHKKGRNKGTPLVSEFYSSEEIYDEPIVIKVKDELILKLNANFSPEKGVYGPSRKVSIRGELVNVTLKERKKLFVNVPLDQKINEVFEFSDKRIVEIILHPTI